MGKKVFTTIRGEDFNRAKKSKAYRCLIWFCLILNQKLITVSNEISNGIKDIFPDKKDQVVMIPNGVNYTPYPLRKKTCDEDRLSIITVGSLIERKDIGTAFRALSVLPQKFTLQIIGDGPEFNNLHILACKMKLAKRVNFVGRVKPNNVSNYLNKSDVFLITSKSEGRPNVVLEAFATGRPVIASDIPGNRELVTHDKNGLLFPVGDHVELAKLLRLTSDYELRLKLSEGGKETIIKRGLSWENTADKYCQLFLK